MSDDETPPIDTAWFRQRLADRRMSQRALARGLGLDPSALSLLLRGKRTMKLQEAADIARLLGVPTDEVLERAGIEHDGTTNFMVIAGWIDPVGEIHFEPDLGETTRPREMPHDGLAVQARTAGSDLDYMDGWILFAARPAEPPALDHIGRLCLVRMTGGVVYLAQPRRGYVRGRWNLAGPAAHATDVALDWTAPILKIRT